MCTMETAIGFSRLESHGWSIASGGIYLHLRCNTNIKPLLNWFYPTPLRPTVW